MAEAENVNKKSVCVQSLGLLYKLSDMGLLHLINQIGVNKYDNTKRVWYFDDDDKGLVQKALDKYRAERIAEKEIKERG